MTDNTSVLEFLKSLKDQSNVKLHSRNSESQLLLFIDVRHQFPTVNIEDKVSSNQHREIKISWKLFYFFLNSKSQKSFHYT